MLSIVIPTYNNKKLTVKSINILDKYLKELKYKYEIILVDDGSLLEERVRQNELPPFVKLIQLNKNKGKGFAVKQGMFEAKGDCCIFTDIDLPYDLEAIPYSYDLIINQKFDIIVGDRTLRNSEFTVKITFLRKLTSLIFSKLVTVFIIGGIFDSQCGYKAFSHRLAKALFPMITINRFAFDVEIFYLLLKYNILIKRIPVRLRNADSTTVSTILHGFEMGIEILKLPIKYYKGQYLSEKLIKFEGEPYWEYYSLKSISRRSAVNNIK